MERLAGHPLSRLAGLGLALGLLVAACASKDQSAVPAPAPAAARQLDTIEIAVAGAGDTGAPLVVAVHGLGDRPESFAKLYRDISAPCRLVLPRGPIPYGDGSSWFDIAIPYAPDAALGARIAAAADEVGALLKDLSRRRAIRGKPLITGFSQGGMISFAVAVRHPDVIGVAVPLAGALPESVLPTSPAPRGAPAIRAFHGAADDLVPVEHARRTVDALPAAGFD
ncbi:MAG: hypothetical protein M0R80_30120, partial [Proteobacteria bacterium]|nr:hypothetical protein [Pseudomonadota bacterium]